MTAPAKAPARRLLATYPTLVDAASAAVWWAGPPEHATDVQVQHSVAGTTPEREWGVTAAKPSPGGGTA